MTPEQCSQITASINAQGERITRLEERLGVGATRDWVTDTLKPVQETLSKLQQSLARLGDIQDHMNERQDELYSAHSALLKDRQEQERTIYEAQIKALQDDRDAKVAGFKAERDAKKLVARLKNAAPAFSIATAIIALLSTFMYVLKALIDSWLLSHGIK